MSSTNIAPIVRAVLERHGVFVSRVGPVGPANVEQHMLAGASRTAAIEAVVRQVIGEPVSDERNGHEDLQTESPPDQ